MLVILVITPGGCVSKTSFVPERLVPPDELTGVQSKTINDVTVSVSILTDEQARAHFRVDLGSKGLQALWMKVRNLRWEQSSAPVAEGQSEEAERYVHPIGPKDNL